MGYSLFVIACCPKIHAPSLLKRLVKEPVQFWTKNNAKKKKKKNCTQKDLWRKIVYWCLFNGLMEQTYCYLKSCLKLSNKIFFDSYSS